MDFSAEILSDQRRKVEKEFSSKLRAELTKNIKERMTLLGINARTLTEELRNKGANVNSFAVRSWLRKEKNRTSLPTAVNLVYLSEILSTDINTLLGHPVEQISQPGGFYRLLRQPENRTEERIVKILRDVENFYRASGESYVQKPLETMFEFDRIEMDGLCEDRDTDRMAFYHLLDSDLIRIETGSEPDIVKRDHALESYLRDEWSVVDGLRTIDDVRVFKLPNSDGRSEHSYNGIAEVVFFRWAAAYLEQMVRPNKSIGIAGGKTISAMMKLMRRGDNLKGCTFFPLLTSSPYFAASTFTSAAIVADVLFRLGDLGIRTFHGVKNMDERRKSADILCFSLGNSRYSAMISILRKVRHSIDRDEIEKELAGDILFTIFTRDGRTLDTVRDGCLKPETLLEHIAWEILGPREGCTEDIPEAGKEILVKMRNRFKDDIGNNRMEIPDLVEYASQPDHRTIVVAGGVDKKDILQVFRSICKPGMNFTLITEQSLAQALRDSARGIQDG